MGHTLINNVVDIYSNGNPTTIGYTVTAGSTVLIVALHCAAERAGGTPTWNGDNMTDSGEGIVGEGTAELNTEVWYIIDPDAGANDLVIPNTGSDVFRTQIAEFKADTASVFNGGDSAISAGSTNPTATITTTEDTCLVYAAMGHGRFTNDETADWTEIDSTDAGSNIYASQYTNQVGAGEISMSWTQSQSDDWSIVTIAIEDEAAAGGATMPLFMLALNHWNGGVTWAGQLKKTLNMCQRVLE